jgi:hypothetical protein
MVTGRRFDRPEAMPDGSDPQITNVLAAELTVVGALPTGTVLALEPIG